MNRLNPLASLWNPLAQMGAPALGGSSALQAADPLQMLMALLGHSATAGSGQQASQVCGCGAGTEQGGACQCGCACCQKNQSLGF